MTMICVEFTQLLAKKILCYSNVLRKYIAGTLNCTCLYSLHMYFLLCNWIFYSLNCVTGNHHFIQCWSIRIYSVKFNDVSLVIMDIACQFYLSSSSLIIYQFSLQVKIVCSDIQSLHYAISTVFQLFSVYKAEEIHIPPLLVSISIQLAAINQSPLTILFHSMTLAHIVLFVDRWLARYSLPRNLVGYFSREITHEKFTQKHHWYPIFEQD